LNEGEEVMGIDLGSIRFSDETREMYEKILADFLARCYAPTQGVKKDPEAWLTENVEENQMQFAADMVSKYSKVCAAHTQEIKDANELLQILKLDHEIYRTDGGFINMPKVKAALKNPDDYPMMDKVPAASAIPHLAERKLWLAQREAGTNEVWQLVDVNDKYVDIPKDVEPRWLPGVVYRVKPKTVKRYMAMLKDSQPYVYAFMADTTADIIEHVKHWNITIIGDIVEREVEIE